MRSQNSILTHTTHSLNALSLTTNQIKSKDQQLQQHNHNSSTTHHYTTEPIQMTTGGSISGNNTNSVVTQQKSSTSTLSSCNTIASTSSINTLSKASTISSTARHSNGNLSTHSNNINNNSTTAVNNNNNKTKNNNNNNNNSHNNNNNNEGNINPNPNWNKLQTLEQRKLELEKLLNEKNWLLQQIHKQEAQILNGNYENFNLFETEKVGGTIVNAGNTTGANTTNSILRRKGSSSLKLSKSNVHFNGKNNRLTLSKSEYDLAQENKLNHQPTTTNQSVMSIKKRQGPPQKTNSFHDSTSASALSLTKSPSFDYNGSTAAQSPIGGNSSHIIKYSVVRPHQGSTENLSNNIGVTQCDKYYLSPTSQMYSDGSGFIKASQNIKQCLSPSPLHKIIALNDTDGHRTKQQQLLSTNGHKPVHHNGSQPHLEQYESVDALSLSPSTNCAFDQGQHIVNQHSNLWRTISNSDRSVWCDSTSYVELDSDGGNAYHNIKSLAKKVLPGSSMQQSPESPSLGNFYPVGGMGGVGSYPNAVDKASDEISISSVNSETSKKPKNKQWMESSLDGPIIRPNILQSTPSVVDAIALCPALSPTLSQNPQYTYYVAGRQATSSSAAVAAAASGKLTPSPAPAAGGGSLLMPVVTSRPPTRTLTHHSHPHHKQSYRERTKLSSQSMSSGSYRAPKTKLDDDNNHLSHSTSFLNVDPYHQHNFHMQPSPQHQQQQQPYHHNHYHTEMTNNGNFTLPHLLLQQQHAPQMHHQKPPLKPTPSSTSQQPTLAKFSPTIQQQCTNGDDFVGTIRYATSVATQPSRLCNPSQAITKNTMQKAIPPNSLSINPGPQLSPQTSAIAATSPDIRIESPKNMTVVQQATFLPYKEVTKPFEMSDFYKYSTKFRQKDANTATISKNTS